MRALGAAETGACGALVPILALVSGAVFLGEEVDAPKVGAASWSPGRVRDLGHP